MNTTLQEEKKQVRLSWQELANTLLQERSIKIASDQTLIVHQIDPSDFLSLVEENNAQAKVQLFASMLRRFSMEISFEGLITLGSFNLSDYSWQMTPGEKGFIQIHAKPATMRKPLAEVISFLSKLPVGQAIVLRAQQDLFLEEISSDAMFDYYQHCQNDSDPLAREAGQDQMFVASSPQLQESGRLLKIYGLNAKQVNRTIDAGAGGVLFTPIGNEEFKEPRLVLGLIDPSAAS